LPRALQFLVGLPSPLFRLFLTFARVDAFVAGRTLLTDEAAADRFMGAIEREVDKTLDKLPPVAKKPIKAS